MTAYLSTKIEVGSDVETLMSRTPGKMGRFDVKNEEKAPLDANKRGK